MIVEGLKGQMKISSEDALDVAYLKDLLANGVEITMECSHFKEGFIESDEEILVLTIGKK